MDDHLSHPGTDRRAKGAVSLIDGGTPLPESSVVYLAHEKGAAEDQWTRITSQENLAAVNANPEQFDLLTLFTIPVDDLARAPIAHVVRARTELDQIERRKAKAERRAEDRHPGAPLQWDDYPDLLAMKAAANDLQSAVERANEASLSFFQFRTEDAGAAIGYIKYLADLAGKSQAGRCRAQGGDTSEESAGAASQSQAVPSELASHLRAIAADPMYADHVHAKKSTLLAAADEIDRLSHSAATGKAPAVLDLPGAIMNIPCRRKDSEFNNAADRLLYKEGHRDARHAAADLVLERADELAALASPAAPLAGKAEHSRFGSPELQARILANLTAPLAAAVPAEEAPLTAEQMTDLFHAIARKNGIETISVNGKTEDDNKLVFTLAELFHVLSGGATPAEPAPILASTLTEQHIIAAWNETEAGGMVGRYIRFARVIERLARLSKPTAQGTACTACKGQGGFETSECGEGCCRTGVECDVCNGTGMVYTGPVGDPPEQCEACFDQEPVGQSPAQVTGEPVSVLDIMSLIREQGHKQYLAGVTNDHPDWSRMAEIEASIRHIAAQAPAGRDAILEEAAQLCEAQTGLSESEMGIAKGCAAAVRWLKKPKNAAALKSHAAEQTSGGEHA